MLFSYSPVIILYLVTNIEKFKWCTYAFQLTYRISKVVLVHVAVRFGCIYLRQSDISDCIIFLKSINCVTDIAILVAHIRTKRYVHLFPFLSTGYAYITEFNVNLSIGLMYLKS